MSSAVLLEWQNPCGYGLVGKRLGHRRVKLPGTLNGPEKGRVTGALFLHYSKKVVNYVRFQGSKVELCRLSQVALFGYGNLGPLSRDL